MLGRPPRGTPDERHWHAAWRAASKRLLVSADETARVAGVPYLMAAEVCRVKALLVAYGIPIAMLSEIEWEAARELNRVKSSYKKRQAAIVEWQQKRRGGE